MVIYSIFIRLRLVMRKYFKKRYSRKWIFKSMNVMWKSKKMKIKNKNIKKISFPFLSMTKFGKFISQKVFFP